MPEPEETNPIPLPPDEPLGSAPEAVPPADSSEPPSGATGPEAAIEIRGLVKRYGKRTAVDGLELSVRKGDIFGFVGPNGAGKTSTIRIITGLLKPSAGEVRVGGYSVKTEPEMVKRQVGYMPDYFGVYPDLLVGEYLEFFSACYGIPAPQRPALVSSLLELVDLAHRENDSVDRLSRGMKQRLSLARTLIHDPQVLVLDEPASGLDPRARVEIRELLVELSRMGKTVFFSTHILADVAEICTRVGILEAGKLVAEGSLEALHLQVMPVRQVQITLLERPEQAGTLLEGLPGVENVRLAPNSQGLEGLAGERSSLILDYSGDDRGLSQVLNQLVAAGFPVLHFREETRDLEEVFLRATQGAVT